MKHLVTHLGKALLWGTLLASAWQAQANEAVIRKNLAERLPNLPKIDEVRATPMKGLFEVRVNQSELLYTDADGQFILQGQLIDTKTRTNLTEQRLDKLTAIDFKDLPLADSFTLVRGKGTRKMAIFEDPNCGFCKRFEKDLASLNDVTIHIFLYPILGQDSQTKAQNIWCAKDKAKAWDDWMQRGITPAAASCDTAALARNVAFGQKMRITGTPTTLFVNGHRLPGAVSRAEVEKQLNATP